MLVRRVSKGSTPPLKPSLRVVTPTEGEAHAYDGLVTAFLQGDERAFAELAALHQRQLYAILRRYAPRPEDARDLLQKALLQAFAAAPRVARRLRREPRGFKPWLFRIAVNVGKNHARRLRLWRMEPESRLGHVPDPGTSPSDSLEAAEQRRRMLAAVQRLPNRQREVVILRIDGDLSFQEIAATLGISPNNAVVNFHYAVQRLKALMSEEQP